MKLNLKSILNLTWKVGLGLFGLVTLVIGILIVREWYDDTFGRCSWRDLELSKSVTVHCFNDYSVRVWNTQTASYTTPKLRWVSCTPERDSITVYCDKNGNRGYINCNTGVIVIPAEKARYRHAWHFSEGRAFVVLPDENGLSVVDHEGKIIARNVAPYRNGCDYVFWNGLCELHKDGKTGLLSQDGTWAIEPKYYEIWDPNAGFGYRMAINEEGYWLYDPDLKLVYSEPYDKLAFAIGREEGTGTLYRTRNHVKQLVNYDGSMVEPFVIDGTYELKYIIRYHEDEANEYALDPDLVVYRVDEWEGLMNKHTGRLITPANYTDFEMISKELIKAELSYREEGNAVIMNRNGRVVKQLTTIPK